MKKCPQCGREYDNTMSFCLDHGAELLYGPASAHEPATAILQIQNDHTIELDPNFSSAYNILGLAYLRQGRNAEAIASLEKAVELSSRAGVTLKDLGYGYGVTGKRTEAIAIVKELEEKYARKESNGMYVAAVYAGLGDKYESLRHDLRYRDLLKRINLPE